MAKGSQLLKTIIINLVLITMVICIIVPLYMTFINSFKTDPSSITLYPLSPVKMTLDNFKTIFMDKYNNVSGMYLNSILITGISVALMIILAPMAGYFIARTKSRLSLILSILFISGIMIPDEVTVLPLVSIYSKLKLIGTAYGLFIFILGARSVVSIFLYEKFIKSLPKELEESAVVDGAGVYRIFWKIIFPLLKPCTATVIIFVGLNIWNDFLMPLFLLGNTGVKTITVGIYSALGEYVQNWGLAFAWVVAAAAPITILFLSFQNYFISGMTEGAIKG
jgi:raffinose/stachyose/melibiose transport system permease protein